MDIIVIVTQLNKEPKLCETGEALQIYSVSNHILSLHNVFKNPLDVLERLPKVTCYSMNVFTKHNQILFIDKAKKDSLGKRKWLGSWWKEYVITSNG